MISRKELLDGYRSVLNVEITDDELHQMFDNVDTDGSGVIDYSEFISATIDRK